MTQDNVMQTLAKLYAHAESAKAIGNEAEAEAFAAKVQELLIKHKLSMSEVEMQTQQESDPVEQEYVDYSKYAPDQSGRQRVWWQEQLINVVARAHFCRIMVVPGSTNVCLVGRESDRQVASYVFEVLSRTALRLAARGYGRARRRKEDTRGYFTSFHQGFINRISERYREERQRIEQALPPAEKGTALVRLKDEQAAVNDYVDAHSSGSAGSTGRNSRHSESAYGDGRKAGDGASIHGRAVGRGGRTARKLNS